MSNLHTCLHCFEDLNIEDIDIDYEELDTGEILYFHKFCRDNDLKDHIEEDLNDEIN